MSAFHLAYTVSDLDSARKFYGDLLGCREGRSTESWVDFDFFGNQLSLHIGQTIKGLESQSRVDNVEVPLPHFG
ncbi:MAG: dioxygenase, partial [Candidatus Thioglobus sp.]|nr:dioxygenase [Candidatus Thioglobus sp.]